MGWIGGSSDAAGPRPYGAMLLWESPRPVWAVDVDSAVVRVVRSSEGRYRLGVIGDCYATDAELLAGLAATARGTWRELSRWPGSYWAVADDGHRTVVLTDVCGRRPVYFTRTSGVAVWASAAQPLADLTDATIDFPVLVARLYYIPRS